VVAEKRLMCRSVGLGNSLHVTEKLLGHARAATTQGYAHLADGVVRQASEVMGAAIEKAMGGKD
jgi:type IV secretory pathway TrbL component